MNFVKKKLKILLFISFSSRAEIDINLEESVLCDTLFKNININTNALDKIKITMPI